MHPLTRRLSDEQFQEPPQGLAGCICDVHHQCLQLIIAGSQHQPHRLLLVSTVQLYRKEVLVDTYGIHSTVFRYVLYSHSTTQLA